MGSAYQLWLRKAFIPFAVVSKASRDWGRWISIQISFYHGKVIYRKGICPVAEQLYEDSLFHHDLAKP